MTPDERNANLARGRAALAERRAAAKSAPAGQPMVETDDAPVVRRAARGLRSTNGLRRTSNPQPARLDTAARDNPFLIRDESILPHVPDDVRYAYLWMRSHLGGSPDGGNIHMHLGGRLRYEVVPPTEMPTMVPLSTTQAQLGSCIQVKDVVLVRTSRRMRDLYLEACAIDAKRLHAETKRKQRDEFRDAGGRLDIEDREEVEYAEVGGEN